MLETDALQDEDGHPVFLLGLTMAGAVSAGAYTAGVLDYLFRAIDAHNERVDGGLSEGDPDAPRHKVVVKAMSGASAGGMCVGLALASLIKARTGNGTESAGRTRIVAKNGFDYSARRKDASGPVEARCIYALEPIFDAWVTNIRLWGPGADGSDEGGFLDTRDLDGKSTILGTPDLPRTPDMEKAPANSALDSTHIDDAARDALSGIPAVSANGPRYDFLATQFELFLTTSSLNGVPYEVKFAGEENGYRMAKHGVARHFRVTGLGSFDWASAWLDYWRDEGIHLDPTEVGRDGNLPLFVETSNWFLLSTGSVASGAFPVGLAPRYIAATTAEMGSTDHESGRSKGGALPFEIPPELLDRVARPDWGFAAKGNEPVPYVAVDGGVINNEPFGLAQYAIRRPADRQKRTFLPNAREDDKADRAVIMVDPFPEGPHHRPMNAKGAVELAGLLGSVKSLFPMLMAQARFKPTELANAYDRKIYSRFLIAPRRSLPPSLADRPVAHGSQPFNRVSGADAIACGALSGFSGFFDEDFRKHDFILGQRNCQRFLEKVFLLPADNDVLGLGEDHRQRTDAANRRADAGGNELDIEVNREVFRRIVDPYRADIEAHPLKAQIYEPIWPTISRSKLNMLHAKAEARFERVAQRILDSTVKKWFFKLVLKRLWYGLPMKYPGAKTKLLELVSRKVLDAFVDRGQHRELAGYDAEIRSAYRFMLDLDEALEPGEIVSRMKTRREELVSEEPHAAPMAVPERDKLSDKLAEMEELGLVVSPRINIFGPPKYRVRLGN
ncbi:MAG: hypothetical protein AAFX02_00580 [Pseudomonadota bacterium]